MNEMEQLNGDNLKVYKGERGRNVNETITALAFILITVLTACAQKYDPESDFLVERKENRIIITKYVGSKTAVNIPPIIKNLPVTSIGDNAFVLCEGLTSVTIPDSVTSIGNGAFSGCTSLTSITIPDSVTGIGHRAFTFCDSLAAIDVGSDNTAYSSDNGVLYNKSKTTLVAYPGGKTGAFIIPDSVAIIEASAFEDCTSLNGVTIPGSVTSIEYSAFYGCTGLTGVTIPGSVTSIGYSAFYGCTGLISVILSNSLIRTAAEAFTGCTNLTSVTFQGTSTSSSFSYSFHGDLRDKYLAGGMGTYTRAKNGYTWTKSALAVQELLNREDFLCHVIEKSITIIKYTGNNASVEIPTSINDLPVTAIGDGAFSFCFSLTSVIIPSSVTVIGNGAFSFCSSLTNVTLPSSVIVIGVSAFLMCSNLTSVTIPPSVTVIGDWAFKGCSSLTSVTLSSMTFVGKETFDDGVLIQYRDDGVLINIGIRRFL